MIFHKWWPRPAPYGDVWRAMQAFTDEREPSSPDEIWLVEHAPVYTLGQAGKPEHILDSGTIPVVRCDRGGQVTYHGPGQVVVYCLIDLHRLGIFVKEYVALIEDVTIESLREMGVANACRKPSAPGVYVPMSRAPMPGAELAKIAALGIKVHKGCAYHGVALNVGMDLSPFLGINPCGYEGLRTVDLATCGIHVPIERAGEIFVKHLDRAIDDLRRVHSDGRHKAGLSN
ncbi:MAG: lipoyl(octanoyl) transferase LipB [Burkholderiaceae bacterium]